MDAIQPFSPRAPIAVTPIVSRETSGPTDAFHPTVADDAPTYKATAKQEEDRKADAALLASCGEGCGCLTCAPNDTDPVKALEEMDQGVREHEAQHFIIAGDCAVGGPTYTMVTARNGKSYAVGGKVHVDVSEVPNDPKATVEKMKRIQRAALAPNDPSAQDRRVAAEAAGKQLAAEARLREMGPAHPSPALAGRSSRNADHDRR